MIISNYSNEINVSNESGTLPPTLIGFANNTCFLKETLCRVF